MNGRERLLTALRHGAPGARLDHVPAAPDLFEMIPIRLSGRPSWEMLVYQDPPVWKARADAAEHFGVDAFVPLGVPMALPDHTAIVERTDERLITRDFFESDGRRVWSAFANVYTPDEPSAYVKAETIGLPNEHESFESFTPNYTKVGREHFEDARAYIGDRGLAAPFVFLPVLGPWPEDAMEYLTDPDACVARIDAMGEAMMEQARELISWKPDVILIGNSGMMIFNPPHIFRHLTLKWFKKVTRLAAEAGVPTHLHCCGPERALVEIAAEETDLTGIEPLEIPPMGDCDLKDLNARFGDKLTLKGNLHTTDIMLLGTVEQVEDACKQAIDDAAEGGGFILSTGDQTPRDTPDENIRAMQRIAETHGRY